MTEILLCRSLRGLIKTAVEDMVLCGPDGARCAPEVYNGFLPFRTQGRDGFPFVVVRPVSSSSDDQSITTEVLISIGCFYEVATSPAGETSPDGYEETLLVVERIRQALADLPNGVLESRYILESPVSMSVPEDQAVPYWQVDMTTTWRFRIPIKTNLEHL